MKNKLNTINCSYCHEENPIYNLECNKCNAILRNKIVNIDLWSTIAKIIEEPIKTLQNIIIAQNKNYIYFLTVLVSIKFYINSQLIILASGSQISFSFKVLVFEILMMFFALSVSALLLGILLGQNKYVSRFIDNYSIITYSNIPFIISLIILTPLEIAVFGITFFTFDPSPFLIKPALAYFFVALEILMILWSIFLIMISIFIQSGSKVFSLFFGLIIFLLHTTIAYYSIKLFNLISYL
jgi:hypothetical protein